MERACLDFGKNGGTGRMDLKDGERKKGLHAGLNRKT
jgi:hypothetical protein